MIPVANHIQYLITQHDCVIIPGFGALIAHYRSAHIDPATDMFCPPSRAVVFNPAIDHDDALIASSISRLDKMPYESAVRSVSDYVVAIRRQLEAERCFNLARIGMFRLTDDNRILFDPADDSIANARYFGLQQLPVVPLAINDPQTGNELHNDSTIPHVSLGRRVIRVAASVAILVALGLTLSTPISQSTAEGIDLAAIGLTAKRVSNDDTVVKPFEIQPDRQDALLLLDIPDPAVATADVIKSRKQTALAPEVTGHKYFLIVASLETKAKAEQYLKRHASENYRIIEGQGRYRIYAASGNSIAEASAIMDDSDFRNAHPDAWVHRAR